MTRYSYIALCELSIVALSFLAVVESAGADSNILEPAAGRTYIRIIGDRQPPVRLPAKGQATRAEPDISASRREVEREAAEKREQEWLAEVKAEQENEAAFLTAIARLKVRKAEETNKSAETPAKLKKTTPIKQPGRRNKAIKKGQNNCK